LAFALQHIIARRKPQPMRSLSDHFAPDKSGEGAASGPYGYSEAVL
jgi:hypothetical protein